MGRALLVLLAPIAMIGCKREFNPEFCLGHPDDTRCGQADAPTACTSNTDCPGQVCDVPNAVCVDCTPDDTSACSATTPFCGTDNTCRGCLVDDECAAGVCLPDGSCPAEADIIYASTTGIATAGCGSQAMPCTAPAAITEVTTTKKIVKFLSDAAQDYTVSGSPGLSVNKDVTIDMRGARLRKTSSGSVVTIGAGNNVTILGGEITGLSSGDGITCQTGVLTVIETDIGGNANSGIGDGGCGVVADRAVIHNNGVGITKANGNLTLTRSRILTNANGGIILTTNGTRFTIVGNVFWNNGGQFSGVGGLLLQTDTSTTSRLEFNSFNGNDANSVGGALQCNVAGFVARNNVMFGNGTDEQVTGTCSHVHTISSPGTALTGEGNSASDPMFVNASIGDLHTMPGSPTENAGDPGSDLTGIAAFDADGDPRTAPADLGADQHP